MNSGGKLEGFLEGHFQLVGNHLGKAIAFAVAHAHDAADVADDGFGAHGAEGDDLRDGFAAVFAADVFDDVGAAVVGEVDVDIGGD